MRTILAILYQIKLNLSDRKELLKKWNTERKRRKAIDKFFKNTNEQLRRHNEM